MMNCKHEYKQVGLYYNSINRVSYPCPVYRCTKCGREIIKDNKQRKTFVSKPPKKPKKKINKKIVMWAISIVTVTILTTLLFAAVRFPDPVRYEQYVVQSGDTLWGIAKNSDMWNKTDAYNIIDDMIEKSRINEDHILQPGDIVYIPYYSK